MYDFKKIIAGINKAYQEIEKVSSVIKDKDSDDPNYVIIKSLLLNLDGLNEELKNMSFDFINEIRLKRQKEIEEGKHACTRNPLYVVYDVITSFSEDTSRDVSTSLFDYNDKYIDAKNYYEHLEEEKPSDIPSNEIMGKEGYHDRFITVCFTREAAEQFIKDERHNLEKPRIYVHYAGRRNYQLQDLLQLLGDD